ncbi:hypothetical protein AAEX37_01996 [Oligella sp. MSHR50489EDL]|uniref:hypothetical protein n=1 Tax=Oligella sp. MSHR50489EDL TaxID=3139409 RepID=UPI003D81BB91
MNDTTRYCNGVELDPCLTDKPEEYIFYMPDPFDKEFYKVGYWTGSEKQYRALSRGLVYDSKTSAAKHGEAMVKGVSA